VVVVATLGALAIWDEQLLLPSVDNQGFDEATKLISEYEKRASKSVSLISDDSRLFAATREGARMAQPMKALVLSSMVMLALAPAAAQQPVSHMPNPKLTPGDVIAVTRDELCNGDYTSPAAKIPIALKRRVFDRYKMRPEAGGYNVDHLIPVKLGGSNSLKNLWPQPLSSEWNYHMKNKLEGKLYKMVCNGTIPIERAREEIATDWTGAYKKYIRLSR